MLMVFLEIMMLVKDYIMKLQQGISFLQVQHIGI